MSENTTTLKPTPPEGSGNSSGDSEFQDPQLTHHKMEINLSDPHLKDWLSPQSLQKRRGKEKHYVA